RCLSKPVRFVFFVCIVFLLALSFASPSFCAEDKPGPAGRPKIGLVLGGGGAKGAAHIGVIKVLEELRIPVDYVAGTSMGAIVGALYASGRSAAELEKTLTSIDWDDMFTDSPPRKDIEFRKKREDLQILSKLEIGYGDGKFQVQKGLIQGQKVNVLFETMMMHVADVTDFDRLPIPYRAVAADLETGEMVVIEGGSLADAARASMSVPGIFPPVDIKGRYLIDGGIVRNLPVDIVRGMGAEVIIAIDVGKPFLKRDELGSPLSIVGQMLDIMMKQNVTAQINSLGPADVFIRPELGDIESGDFQRGAEAARFGEAAARRKLDDLKKHSVSPSEYEAFLARHHRDTVSSVKVASVKVEGTQKLSKEYVENKVGIKPGDVVTVERLRREPSLLYGTADFERVDLKVGKGENGYDVTLKMTEKPWKNILRVGFGLTYDFGGDNDFSILFDYTMRQINALGAEWKNQIQIGRPARLYTEFYQPLDPGRFFFVSPRAEWREDYFNVFDGDERVAQYRVRRYDVGLVAGIQPWHYGQISAGILFGGADAEARIGDPGFSDNYARRGALTGSVIVDQLDNVNFPRSGYFAAVNAYSSLDALGADDIYNKVWGRLSGAYTKDKNTILATFRAGSYLGNDLPPYDQFTLGGFGNLSGFSQNQLTGQQVGIATLFLYRQIGKSLLGAMYAGGSIEAGNVWRAGQSVDLNNLIYAGNLFFGFDTLFGPLYLSYGHAEGGNDAVYLFLGNLFRSFDR
ncbi:MAG TPA: patatin-like phospholipase family protein, partial [Dissulfurispiraceae bacterium]|nr:patatin-like phospholipase family protein [Dissulfurispiraceae bacterium]